MKEGLVVVSLFDGLSGGRLSLEQSGVKIKRYYSSEIDRTAICISLKNYPDNIHLGNIQDISIKRLLNGNVLIADKYEEDPSNILLIGGSPCQGFSFAGKQLNFEDPRSKLFFEYIRILNEIKPKYFFLENVKMKREYEEVITSYMKVTPIKINSSILGPQLRSRLYWTNIEYSEITDKGTELNSILENGYVDRTKSYCIDANYGKSGNLKSYFASSRRQLVFNDKESYEKAQEAYLAGNYAIKGLARILTPIEAERAQGLPDNYTECENVSKFNRYKAIGNGWSIYIINRFFRNLS